MADSVVYLYAVTDAAPADEPADEHAPAGVDGVPVRRIVFGDLAAVVSSVDPTRFSEEALRRSLEDLQWLERIARAHNAVVTAAARSGPVAPVRLATVYLDDENVRTLLDERSSEFTAALDRIRGRAEWGVKGFAVRTEGDTSSQATEDSKPGTAYLMRRRAERDRAARGLQDAAEAAEAVHKAMSAVAVASRRYQPQDPRLSGRREEMVLNVAYLVDQAGAEVLRRLVERQQGESLRLELTGPWAPYSFATLEEGP
jgi:Gas vesicle synthesis protein GvpL/GvpF